MKTLKWLLTTTIIFAAYAVLFYLWQFKGVDGAGSVLVTFLWIVSVLGILLAFSKDDRPADQLRRTALQKWVFAIDTMIVFGALAWVGHVFLACAYLLAGFLMYGRREAALRKSELDAAKTA